MLRDDLVDLLRRDPFEPFRIKLVNGDIVDIFHATTATLLETAVFVASQDQNWVLFPIDKINSIESLMADFLGELAEHEGEGPPPSDRPQAG